MLMNSKFCSMALTPLGKCISVVERAGAVEECDECVVKWRDLHLYKHKDCLDKREPPKKLRIDIVVFDGAGPGLDADVLTLCA